MKFYEDLESNNSTLTYPYDSEIKNIKFGLFKRLKKELKVEKLNNNQVQFKIPENSTVFIGMGINTHLWGVESVTIHSNEKTETITDNDIDKINIKMRGLLKYTGHYDIK